MHITRMTRVCCLLALAAALALTGGCRAAEKKVAELTSAWPVADSERSIAQPPQPVRWPLTGIDAPSRAQTRRRVVSVKIENSAVSRPQSNIQGADVVYESVAEGGITRFNAIYHSHQPEILGPVRSARLSDLYIVPQYKAVFLFSGANGQVNARVRKARIENLSQDAGVQYPYYRASDRAAPHNLFARFSRVLVEIKRKGWKKTQDIRPFRFSEVPPPTENTASGIVIPFSQYQTTEWRYDPGTSRYLRSNDGRVHTDKATGKQVHARNVVVLWTKVRAGASGRYGTTLDIVLTGTNRASLFRDGKRYDGRWEAGRSAPPLLRASDGTLMRLAPGNTWFEVIPTNVNISMR